MTKRKNNPMFRVGSTVSVDLTTGEETPVEGGGLMMLPGPPGTCSWCHVKHAADQPHNQQSLSYQIKFQTLHGRAPTWSDAMAHCSPEVQSLWRKGLVERMKHHGLDIPEDLR